MRKIFAISILTIIFSVQLFAEKIITARWDANTDGVTIGYILHYGIAPKVYTTHMTIPGVDTTSAFASGFLVGIRYYFAVNAYNAKGEEGPYSNEISIVLVDPKCDPPLGLNSITIFPTRLVKTGSGNAGSLSEMYFVISSPNSSINYLSVRGNGSDIPDSIMSGDRLKPTLGSRFSVPPIKVNYSIFASNIYGCQAEQPTVFHN